MKTLAPILLLLALAPADLLGQLEGRSLTDGYYRVGEYVPLAIRATSVDLVGQRVTLRVNGAIDTSVEIATIDREVIVPWLPVRRVNGPLTWSAENGATGELPIPLRAIESDQPLSTVDGWTFHADPTFPGPAGTVVGDSAYLPTFGWSPGVPEFVRRQVIVLAMLFSAAILWLSIWRPRGTVGWLIGVSIAMLAVAAWYRGAQSPVHQAVGEIRIVRGDSTCVDRWLFETSPREVTRRIDWADLTHPFFASSEALTDSQMTLRCAPDGTPERFEYRLLPDRRMAFRSRRIEGPTDRAAVSSTLDSPLLPLVKQFYSRPGSKLVGELRPVPGPATVERWDTVVIEE